MPSTTNGDISLKLFPQATIRGRVLDTDGEPIVEGFVRVLSRIWFRGSIRTVPIGGQQLNDLGEFRVANLSPGSYFAVFEPRLVQHDTGPFSNYLHNPSETAATRPVRTFFPGVTTLAQAAAIEISAGETIDLVLTAQTRPTFTVRGRIAGTMALPALQGLISLLPEGEEPLALIAGNGNIRNGAFAFSDVAPGIYKILYLAGASGTGRQLVNVVNNVDNLVVNVEPNASVRGRSRVEGLRDNDNPQMQLTLTSIDSIVGPRREANVQTNGSFAIDGIAPGQYSLHIKRVPGLYLKSVRYGLSDVTARPFHIVGIGDEMELVLSIGAAQLDGKVERGGNVIGATSTSAYFLIVPVKFTFDLTDVRVGATEADGRFLVRDLRPGLYRAYAFESIDLAAVQNPGVLKVLESAGTVFEVAEGEKAAITLNVVSPDTAARAFARKATQ